ncbi:MAG TPA: sigma-70 family RNA polymerase sigma factor [Blastococcus sp.]|jgi:RNA polymerase sigma-70 factor (ECF subfamily)|nr:sigma-70 family RNA polymerase sigma factor [Blastococcus sp.]
MRLRAAGARAAGARGGAARTDEESLRALYDEHAPALLGYALRLTDGDRVRAEDIVQETLLRAWRNLDRLDGNDGPVRPWLFTVAQHLAIDAHRARRARPAEVGDAALAAVPGLDELEGTLDRIIVTDALGALSHEHRAVIVETYYRGRSVAEAARVLGIPPGTVKSRCYYALRALKLALAERGVTT